MAFLIYDDTYLEHDTGPGHPESAERLRAIMAWLEERGLLERLERIEPRPATVGDIRRVHTADHVDAVRAACAAGRAFDADTTTSPGSLKAAALAAGAGLAAADHVMAAPPGAEGRRGLCLVRPPGHHATAEQAMGFCLFNNAAICARYLSDRHGVDRIAIVDFDVHHGNGTEEIFRDDERVFYLSSHRYPFYPGTGGPFTAGRPSQSTRNVPLAENTEREAFLDAFRWGLSAVREFRPEVVLVSAGFDAEKDDPVGGLGLLPEDYRTITDEIVAVARASARGRVISFLEGGYNLKALGACVEHHLLGLE